MKVKSWGWLALAAMVAVFMYVKISSASYSASDENTYYKMGELVASGMVPYNDFFFAHPPLQVYLYAAVFKLFGFNLGILKFISAAAAVVSAFYIFRMLSDRSETAGVVGSALFLFSHSVLLFTSFPTGTEFVMMLSVAGYYYFYRGRSFVSGLLLGIGAITGLLAFVPAAVMGAWLLVKDVFEFRKFVYGFAAIFVPVAGLFTLLTKGAYLTQTVLFNLLKPEGVVDKAAIIMRVMGNNWLLFASFATAIFAKGKLSSRVLVPVATVALFAAAFFTMEIVFDYYSLVLVPFMAIAAAQGLSGAIESFKLRKVAAFSVVAVAVAAVSFLNYSSFSQNDSYDFNFARDAALFVRDNTDPDETIFGEDATTPLVSILSGRAIALDFVDSNDLRFRTGMDDPEMVIDKLRNSSMKFFLVRELDFGESVVLSFGVATLPEFAAFFKEDCSAARVLEEEWRGLTRRYIIYDCS